MTNSIEGGSFLYIPILFNKPVEGGLKGTVGSFQDSMSLRLDSTGNFDSKNVRIKNIGDPEDEQDSINVRYLKSLSFVRRDLSGNVDMEGGKILNIANPQLEEDLITKRYMKSQCIYIKNQNFSCREKKLTNVADPENSEDAINLRYLQTLNLVTKDDDLNINMNSHRIINLGDPQYTNDAISKGYFEGLKNDMQHRRILNVGSALSYKDAVNKKNLDDAISDIKSNFLKREGEIDLQGSKMINIGPPENNNDVISKNYCDEKVTELRSSSLLKDSDNNFDGEGLKITNVANPDDDTDVCNKLYTDALVRSRIDESLQRDTVIESKLENFIEKSDDGTVDIEDNRLINVDDPVDETDGCNKQYADSLIHIFSNDFIPTFPCDVFEIHAIISPSPERARFEFTQDGSVIVGGSMIKEKETIWKMTIPIQLTSGKRYGVRILNASQIFIFVKYNKDDIRLKIHPSRLRRRPFAADPWVREEFPARFVLSTPAYVHEFKANLPPGASSAEYFFIDSELNRIISRGNMTKIEENTWHKTFGYREIDIITGKNYELRVAQGSQVKVIITRRAD